MKTKPILMLACVAALFFQNCKSSYPATSEAKFLSSPAAGLVQIEATGYGKSKQDAELDAYKTAFTTIFFKGLPAFTALRLPMVADEAKAREANPGFFTSFFENRKYMAFVTEQGATTQAGKADDKRSKMARHTFTINYESLRRELESKGVIRKFGL